MFFIILFKKRRWIKLQKILFLLVLFSYNQICLADDNYTFRNFGQFNISLEQRYKEECKEHIRYVKNLKLYQSIERIGREIDQKITYKKNFQKELTDPNKTILLCNFKSGVKFENFLEPYSYIKTELEFNSFHIGLEGYLSATGQGIIFLFEKRF